MSVVGGALRRAAKQFVSRAARSPGFFGDCKTGGLADRSVESRCCVAEVQRFLAVVGLANAK